MVLTFNSYAKVNIGLRVLGRRADGYHDLDTFFHLISLHDKITMTLEEDRKTSVSISGSEAYLPAGKTDLMEKAAVLFSALSGKSFSLHIDIKKSIPSQAGLGGGSSNAAAVLKMLNEAFAFPLGQQQLLDGALELGSDVPFFVTGFFCAHASGRGERLSERQAVSLPALIVRPQGEAVSTAEGFRKLDERAFVPSPLPEWTAEAQEWMDLYPNDFDLIQPVLRRRDYLESVSGSLYHSTTGSGSCQVIVCRDELERDRIESGLRKKESHFDVMRTYLLKDFATGVIFD